MQVSGLSAADAHYDASHKCRRLTRRSLSFPRHTGIEACSMARARANELFGAEGRYHDGERHFRSIFIKHRQYHSADGLRWFVESRLMNYSAIGAKRPLASARLPGL